MSLRKIFSLLTSNLLVPSRAAMEFIFDLDAVLLDCLVETYIEEPLRENVDRTLSSKLGRTKFSSYSGNGGRFLPALIS